jgi:hypothetical protein
MGIMLDRIVNDRRLRLLDHVHDFGSSRSKIMNVIDSNISARDTGGKPLHTFPRPALAAAIALLIASGGLGGCANLGDGPVSGAFVDPAQYDLYDCKQLDAQRKSLAARTIELQKLIDKAHTGVAGSVVAEVAYRNEYTTVRASAKLAEQVWRRDKCDEAPPAASAPASRAGGAPPPRRSGSAVY